MIEIKNLQEETPYFVYDFTVDHTTPFAIPTHWPENDPSSGFEHALCKRYRKHFDNMVGKTDIRYKPFNKSLNVLLKACKKYGRLRLFCWHSWHGDIIKQWLEDQMSK